MIRAESIPPRLTPWKASQSNCYRRAATRAAQAPPRSGQESWTSSHTALKTIGVPTSFGSLHITAINSAFVTASLPVALGGSGRDQQATPYQKTEATLAPITGIESAAEGHAVEAVPAQWTYPSGQQLAGALFSPAPGLNLFLI